MTIAHDVRGDESCGDSHVVESAGEVDSFGKIGYAGCELLRICVVSISVIEKPLSREKCVRCHSVW